VRVPTDGQIHTLTDANRFSNLSHAICYSYGTDKNDRLSVLGSSLTGRFPDVIDIAALSKTALRDSRSSDNDEDAVLTYDVVGARLCSPATEATSEYGRVIRCLIIIS